MPNRLTCKSPSHAGRGELTEVLVIANGSDANEALELLGKHPGSYVADQA